LHFNGRNCRFVGKQDGKDEWRAWPWKIAPHAHRQPHPTDATDIELS